MAIREGRGPWFSASGSPDLVLHVYKKTFHLSKNALLSKSAKLYRLLKEKQRQHQDLSCSFQDIPADANIFELVLDFCYGRELLLSAENVVPLACLASYLEMTEEYCCNNLLKKAISFFNHKVMPQWKDSIAAFRTCEQVFSESMHLGLTDSCLRSIASKAQSDPHLLGEPIGNSQERPPARRKLFATDDGSQDLFTLPIHLFELIISAMIGCGVPPEYLAGCLYRYWKKCSSGGVSLQDHSLEREVIEAIERLLPDKIGVLPCKSLLEMFQHAVALQASSDCRKGFEVRIGKQLQDAEVEDILIPCSSYSMETQYDMDCVIRILKHFYKSLPEPSGLVQVMELIYGILSKVSADPNLKKETFISLAGMVGLTLKEMGGTTDNLYSVIDVYLSSHGHLTEWERDEVCRVLDVQKLSRGACVHAVQNERLPLRIVVQVLSVGQTRLQEEIHERLPDSDCGSREAEEQEKQMGTGEEEKVREEMEKMDSRVVELEQECGRMRREIEMGGKKKASLWREVKKMLGCSTGLYETNCHVKKIHPKNGAQG